MLETGEKKVTTADGDCRVHAYINVMGLMSQKQEGKAVFVCSFTTTFNRKVVLFAFYFTLKAYETTQAKEKPSVVLLLFFFPSSYKVSMVSKYIGLSAY